MLLRQPALAAALPVPRGSAELGRRRRSSAAETTTSPAARACRCSRTVDPDAGCQSRPSSRRRAPLWELTQNIVEANLQGKIADMRNGELRFAAGVSNRENKFRYEPGGINDNISVIEQPIGIFVSNNTARLDGGLGALRRAAGPGDGAPGSRARLPLFGLRHGRRRRHLQDARRLVGDRQRALRGGYQFATREPNTEELFAGPRLNTVVDFIYGDPCQASTTAPWGNRPPASTRTRLAVQNPLPTTIIDRSDTNRQRRSSAFDTNTGFDATPTGSRRLRAARPAVLPVRERGAARQPEPQRRGSEDLDARRGVQLARQPREPHGVDRLLQHRDHGRDCDDRFDVRVQQVLERGRHQQPDVLAQRSGRLLRHDRAPAVRPASATRSRRRT